MVDLKVKQHPWGPLLEARGDLTEMSSPAFTDEVQEETENDYSKTVVLDLSRMRSIDHSALKDLVRMHHFFRETGGKLILVSLPAEVVEVCQEEGYDRVFVMYESLGAAFSEEQLALASGDEKKGEKKEVRPSQVAPSEVRHQPMVLPPRLKNRSGGDLRDLLSQEGGLDEGRALPSRLQPKNVESDLPYLISSILLLGLGVAIFIEKIW